MGYCVATLRMQGQPIATTLPPLLCAAAISTASLMRTHHAGCELGTSMHAVRPSELEAVQLQLISTRTESHLHNEQIDRYYSQLIRRYPVPNLGLPRAVAKRGKLNAHYQGLLSIRTVWAYPFARNFRRIHTLRITG